MNPFPRRIALVGMRGSGKTTLAKAICRKWDLPFLDGDAILESRLCMSIRDMFEKHGEEWFRDREMECLEEITKSESWVFATGGGVIIRENNRECLKKRALVVWLDATPDILATRVTGDSRSTSGRPPLVGKVLQDSDQARTYEVVHLELATILKDRLNLYRNGSQIRLNANQDSSEQLLEQLEKKLEKRILQKEWV